LAEGKPLFPRKKPSPQEKNPPRKGKIPSPRENLFKRGKSLHQGKNPPSMKESALPKGKIFARPPQNRKKPRSRIDLGSKTI
jgi:hypothetical protein